ncbi:BadF/BadG/BcrA/BcrD ATPase family protein [Inhella gelatinilytica]|uniref:ATPase n=1 Tax=Inhella gelatinilytica TaxID=2795030 RepID=A0A931NE18_9BURK|nr:BadF/BadG/BcrA/BcrD ATPase family protein [Inhella gelatinilytica]MBH9553697.1 ATPase [Inhella gelatinilytica]
MSTRAYASPPPTQSPGTGSFRYWIGIDGGGTHTRARLFDASGHPLAEGTAGPSALGQGVEQAWRHVQQAAQAAARASGLPSLDLSQSVIGLGLSGANNPQHAAAFVAANPGFAQVVLEGDAVTGVLGAHGGQAGSLLIAGTGSIALAHTADGQRRQAGGWGWLNGDEGSGAWLGKAALRLAQRALDGRDPAGTLARAVWALIGNTAEDLLHWQAQAGQARFASLAPLVFEHAPSDDQARTALKTAVLDLEDLVRAVDPEGQLPLVVSGSVGQRLSSAFSAPLQARLRPALGDAMDGALRLARAHLAPSL